MYKRKQNKKGEEVSGLVPHITLKSIANNEEPKMEVLVDRPEVTGNITRVTGPFTMEATLPAAAELAGPKAAATGETPAAYPNGNPETHIERMLEVLRRSRTLNLPGNEKLELSGARRVTDAEHLHAEAVEPGDGVRRIALVFGPEDGAISSAG